MKFACGSSNKLSKDFSKKLKLHEFEKTRSSSGMPRPIVSIDRIWKQRNRKKANGKFYLIKQMSFRTYAPHERNSQNVLQIYTDDACLRVDECFATYKFNQ